MPLVQLDFPNPLNASVQTGDIAYFSNPIPVGGMGNPLNNGDQWDATTTPHLTSPQSDIIMIGVIETIIRWDGTVSSIICDMPQNLFNQYFSQIQSCITTTTTTSATTITTPASTTCLCENQVNNPCPEFNTGDASLPYPYNRINAFALVIQEGLLSGNENINFSELATLAVPTSSQAGLGFDPCVSTLFSGKSLSKINKLVTVDGSVLLNMNTLISYLNSNYTAGLSTNSTFAQIEDAMLASNNFAEYPAISGGVIIDWRSVGTNGEICQCVSGGVTVIPGSTTTNTACDDDKSFIMFSKDNKVNLSSVLGYYASTTFKNNSREKAELFNVGADVFISSK
jgi:hypothetical protein